MRKQLLAKQLAWLSAAAAISMAVPSVMAHTGIRDAVNEGVVSQNAVNITHGCVSGEDSSGAVSKDVIALSVMFPNAADPKLAIIKKMHPTSGAEIGALDDLSGHIVGVLPGVGFTNLGLNTVQPSIWPNFIRYIDNKTLIGRYNTPLKRGFATHNGNPFPSAPIWYSDTSGQAWAPFTVGPISFEKESCALSLLVRVATANWCLRGQANNSDGSRADIWIGHATPKFNDFSTLPFPNDGRSYWPTMRVLRDLTKNPLPTGCGVGYNLSIQPTAEDIDAWLPIPRGRAPFGAPHYFWPSRPARM